MLAFARSKLKNPRLWLAVASTLVFTVVSLTGTVLADGPDPSGVNTIDLKDPTTYPIAINFVWTLIAGFLVFFMQAGFALLEAGSVRAKSVVNVLTKNVVDFLMCGMAFWAFGFALMFGGSKLASGLGEGNKFLGFSGFFLTGDAYDVTAIEVWLFQMVFAATAATIVSGAMAERTKINSYMAYSFLISAFIYPIYGHWVWGGGWLTNMSFLGGVSARDFAGSGVVHAVGGTAALVGALMVGARKGKFGPDGKPRTILGHDMSMVVLGTLILFLGWFGFNPGSTMAGTDLRISVIAVNTFLAGVAGGIVAYYIRFIESGKVDTAAMCSGIIAGLVGITAPSAFVAPWASVVIGAIAGAVVVYGARALENILKLDDPVWAVACHLLAGLWGLLAVGIFADGTYLEVSGLIKGDVNQFLAQLLDMVVVVAWTGLTSLVVFYGINKTIGLRVPEADELAGVDLAEHTQVAFPELVPAPVTSEGPHPAPGNSPTRQRV